jgi:hypothetical protein
MSKMTIIQLLNKIANGEEIPKKIKWNNKIYISKGNAIENFVDYISDDDDYCFEHYIGYSSLNDEVEIIEEDKKIKKITMRAGLVGDIDNKLENLDINIMAVEDKINEIIDKLNEMENE